MQNTVKFLVVLSLAGLVAACGQQEEDDIVIPLPPITVDPPFTGKFK